MGADVEWAILSIMAEIVTPKALSESGCGSATDGDVDNSGGGGEDLHSIGEGLEKGSVESQDFLVDSSIVGLRFHSGGRGSACRRRGRRESRQEGGWRRYSFRWGRNGNRWWRDGCRKLNLLKVMVSFLKSYRKEYSSKCGV